MSDIIKSVKDKTGNTIDVFNLPSDPNMWVVRKYKRLLFLKKMITSKWFNDKDQALAYVEELQKEEGNTKALPDYDQTAEFRHYKTKIL